MMESEEGIVYSGGEISFDLHVGDGKGWTGEAIHVWIPKSFSAQDLSKAFSEVPSLHENEWVIYHENQKPASYFINDEPYKVVEDASVFTLAMV
jgi:hypothetical protein